MSDEERWIEGVWQKVEEKERCLKILSGLERKQESSMLLVAKEFLGAMGIQRLFYGIADVVAVSMVISVYVFVGIYFFLGLDSRYVYSMVFIFSPTLYTSIFCLSYIKETQVHTIHVQMSCRYTFFHVLVFRMLLNSGLAVAFNLIYVCTLNRQFEMNPVKALALSFSSLMLFSVMLAKSLGNRNKIMGVALVNAVWFGVHLLAFQGIRDFYMQLIDRIPMGVSVLAAFVFGVLYCNELKKIISVKEKRRYTNA